MKIDMSSQAITNRLKAVNELRKLCLSLANSSEGRKIKKPLPDGRVIQQAKPDLSDRDSG
jgi:hypothetical protein